MIRPRPEGNEAGQTCSRHPAPPGFDANLSLNHPPSRRATRIRSDRVAGHDFAHRWCRKPVPTFRRDAACPTARTTRTSSGFPFGALRRSLQGLPARFTWPVAGVYSHVGQSGYPFTGSGKCAISLLRGPWILYGIPYPSSWRRNPRTTVSSQKF